jgi:hypothetical protein
MFPWAARGGERVSKVGVGAGARIGEWDTKEYHLLSLVHPCFPLFIQSFWTEMHSLAREGRRHLELETGKDRGRNVNVSCKPILKFDYVYRFNSRT